MLQIYTHSEYVPFVQSPFRMTGCDFAAHQTLIYYSAGLISNHKVTSRYGSHSEHPAYDTLILHATAKPTTRERLIEAIQ